MKDKRTEFPDTGTDTAENTVELSDENTDTSEEELNGYLEIRRNRLQKRKTGRKRAGLAMFTAALLLVMGASFQYAWMKAGQTPPPDSGDTLADSAQEAVSGKVQEQTEEQEEDPQAEPGAAQNKEQEADGAPETEEEPEVVIPEEPEQPAEESENVKAARFAASQYDYDKALSLLNAEPDFGTNQALQTLAGEIQAEKDSCTAWPLKEVTHVFYHTLIRDPSLAFDGDSREAGYNQYMTTIAEFQQITQSMYDKGYVMVSIYDIAKVDGNGNMVPGEILLPPGKIPFVLSQDDVCYYHYMDGDGMAQKLIVDEDGKIRNTYLETDGSTSIGDYDMVPLIDRFVEEHPDFSYRGAKGIVALTGYDGILGYRTDITYQTKPDDMDDNKKKWLEEHPDFDLESERAAAENLVAAMKAEGWLFASHTWGHLNVGEVSFDRLKADTERFLENVDPLVGGTDIIIFAFGTDLSDYAEYSGEKYEYLRGKGYRYFCNVDSSKYFVQMTDQYLRMGRRNLDGYRMYYNPDMLADLFDASAVFDSSRPTPVPPMN